eukprot:SM000018S03558  [mRNA]  locus=s18:34600:35835:+ [translate_table: standard]
MGAAVPEPPPPRRGRHALVDVRTTRSGMEYSVHSCPEHYKRELAAMFPGQDLGDVVIVPTCQRAAMELVRFGDEVEAEKDRLLEVFMAWAQAVHKEASSLGYFCDYIDPCSGLPMVHRGTSTVYSEVDALQFFLGYSCQNAGCCKVVLHPKWGSAVYPATLLTNAPPALLLNLIAKVDQ